MSCRAEAIDLELFEPLIVSIIKNYNLVDITQVSPGYSQNYIY